jgi:hypothetical protein
MMQQKAGNVKGGMLAEETPMFSTFATTRHPGGGHSSKNNFHKNKTRVQLAAEKSSPQSPSEASPQGSFETGIHT